MPQPDASRRRSHAILAGMAFLVVGCASSSTTSAPAPPQPPSPPATAEPQTRKDSAPPTKADARGKKQAEPGPNAEVKANPGAEASGDSKEGQAASQPAIAGGRGEAPAETGVATATATTPDEQRAALDGKLESSMAEFDALLLKQQKELEDKQRKDPLPERGGGGGAGGSTGGGTGTEGSAGGSGDPASGKAGSGERKDDRTPGERRAQAEAEAKAKAEANKGKTSDGGASTEDTGTGNSKDAGQTKGGTPVTAPVEGGPAGPGSDVPAVPPDVGDGKNDDVVARQLREAAMNEKNPAIRAKLWDEYREYKKSAGKGGK